jgi:hypothetical protein
VRPSVNPSSQRLYKRRQPVALASSTYEQLSARLKCPEGTLLQAFRSSRAQGRVRASSPCVPSGLGGTGVGRFPGVETPGSIPASLRGFSVALNPRMGAGHQLECPWGDSARIKAACWRGSPAPSARPSPGSRGRRADCPAAGRSGTTGRCSGRPGTAYRSGRCPRSE